MYADDIILISPSDKQLHILLDVCNDFGKKWKIKFNANKSRIISFGNQIDNNFYIDGLELSKENSFKYLGITFDEDLNTYGYFINKMKNSYKTIFYLKHIGIASYNLDPFLQLFIYRTICLSNVKYGLESCFVSASTLEELNLFQNKIIKFMLHLGKYNHISRILRMLRTFNLKQLYVYTKLCFIESIKNIDITNKILEFILNDSIPRRRQSKSMVKCFALVESLCNMDIKSVNKNTKQLKEKLKDLFKGKDGIDDSISLCLCNFKKPLFRTMLNRLTKLNFD